MYSIKIIVFLLTIFILNCQTVQKDKTIYTKKFNRSIFLSLNKTSRVVPTIYLSLNKKKKLKFIIDTGSNASYLDEKFFKKDEAIKSYTKMTLPSKKSLIQESYIQSFSLYHENKLVAKDEFFYSNSMLRKSDIDGIIGLNILRKTIIFLEYPNYIGFLHRKDPFITEFKKENHIRLPLNISQDAIFINMNLKNPNFYLENMIFDSGAGISVLKRSILLRTNSKEVGSITYVDLSNHKKSESTYLVNNLCTRTYHCVNNTKFIGVDFLQNFEKTHNKKISGILGLNWIEKYKILIDNRQKIIRMIPNL